MASKVLNFVNGMELARIVLQYFDAETIKASSRESLVLDFIERASTDEVAKMIRMFTFEDKISDDSGAMAAVIGGLASADLYNLVITYTKAGFAHDA